MSKACLPVRTLPDCVVQAGALAGGHEPFRRNPSGWLRRDKSRLGGTIINVIDDGRAAASKERPQRSIIVIWSLLLSLIGSVGSVVVFERNKENTSVFWQKANALLRAPPRT